MMLLLILTGVLGYAASTTPVTLFSVFAEALLAKRALNLAPTSVAIIHPKKQKRCRLLWTNLKCKGELLSIDEFEKIPIEVSTEVYFYNEREKKNPADNSCRFHTYIPTFQIGIFSSAVCGSVC